MARLDAPSGRTFSLRAHLLLLVIGTTLPVLLVLAVLVQRVVADARNAVEQQLLEAARAEAAVVDAELQGTIRALQGLAVSDHLTYDEIPAFYAQAEHLRLTQPTWSAVSLSTPDGLQIANTTRRLGDPLPFVTDPESFGRATSTNMPSIGNLRIGSVSHQWGFPVRVPVAHDGRPKYVVSAWISAANFAKVLGERASLSDEWTRAVLDTAGVYVARTRGLERFVGQKGTRAFVQRSQERDESVNRDVTLEGMPVYGAFTRAPMSGWIAGVAVPASVVDASFWRSMLALGTVTLLLLGFGGGGTYLISRRISRDISDSAAVAEAIAAGLRPSTPQSRVTEIERLVDALARSAALLDVRQRERDEHLALAEAARTEAEAADRAKDQFLAMLGHELRNPLAPALTALHLMKLRAGASAVREREVIERQVRHMARLVDDLLDVSRVRRGAIDLRKEPLELGDAVARAVEMTTPSFSEKHHYLEIDVPPGLVIDADKVRIAQVVANVLTNAAKYTNPGGDIRLHAWKENGQIVVECCDNGMGMPADLVPNVFELFMQGPRGIDRRQGGLGLGLALARTLVELHGGTIEARSAGTDQGSTFTIRLPAAETIVPSKAIAGTGGHMKAQTSVGRVMVVDDNRDALETLLEALKEAGVETFGAATSMEALDLALRVQPHVAVLDIGLPEMDGFHLARALRSLVGIGQMRLIALTGYGREQDMTAARDAGFDAFFVKPVDVSTLLEALDQPLV